MRFLLVLIINLNLYAASTCTEIHNIAKKYSNYPTTIATIALGESSCGKTRMGDDGKSIGIMQIQLPTLRYLITKTPEIQYLSKLTNEELTILLHQNDEVSIILATKYFLLLKKRYGFTEAVIRYNGYWKKLNNGKRIRNIAYYHKFLRNKEILKDLLERGL